MLYLFAAALLATAQPTMASEGVISRIVVQGVGEVKTAPDVARLSYDVRGEGSTNDKAVEALVAASSVIEGALRSIDPAIIVTSESVRVQTVRPNDCDESEYDGAVHLSTGECAIKGYVAIQDFNLRTTRVSDAGTLVGLAARRGAYNPKIESFGLTDQSQAKRNAIAKAMADARTKAEAVAASTNASLGEILKVGLDNAREGFEEIVVTGSSIRAEPERDKPIQVSVNPSPVETSAQVTVTYAIVR